MVFTGLKASPGPKADVCEERGAPSKCAGGAVGRGGVEGCFPGSEWGVRRPFSRETFHPSEGYCRISASEGNRKHVAADPGDIKRADLDERVLTLAAGLCPLPHTCSLFFPLSSSLFCSISLFLFSNPSLPFPLGLPCFPFSTSVCLSFLTSPFSWLAFPFSLILSPISPTLSPLISPSVPHTRTGV